MRATDAVYGSGERISRRGGASISQPMKKGFAILYVTHDQAEAMALSDRLLVMRAGVVQQVGTPLDVYRAPANRFVFEFIGLSSFLPAALAAGTMRVGGENAPWPATAPPTRARRRGRSGPRRPPDRDRVRRRRWRAWRGCAQGVPRRDDRLPDRRRRRRGAGAEVPARGRPGRRRGLRAPVPAGALVSAGLRRCERIPHDRSSRPNGPTRRCKCSP